MKTLKSKITFYDKPFYNPNVIIRELRRERIKTFLKYLAFSIMGAVAIGIIYICLTSNNDTDKMNECLKTHDLNYCNKAVK